MEITTDKAKEEQDSSQPNNSFSAEIDQIMTEQREFFRSLATRSYNFRKSQLRKLKSIIESNEAKIHEALYLDLGRSEFMGSFTVGAVITEIKYALDLVFQLKPPFITRRLNQWMKVQKKRSPIFFLGNKVKLEPVPRGVVLIMGPWNYPFLLLMAPLIGAIAGGNCAILKPSEVAPHTSKIIAELINTNFHRNYLYVAEGGVEEAITLNNKPQWDYIFFTGGTDIGRSVYHAAAENLIPVTLELGGKSPTIIDKDIYLDITAKRLVQMKFTNAGQTCMAPDYVFVHKQVKEDLIKEMKKYLKQYYSEDAKTSPNYGKIINGKHLNRLLPLIKDENIVVGGDYSDEDRHLGPTILADVKTDAPVMQEEIFGPILPMITWEDEDELIDYIESNPHPLAIYLYTKNKEFKDKIFSQVTSGAGMVNDSVLYYLHPEVPFGGVGDSGFGNYTGKFSFDTFTRVRPIVETGGFVDRFSEKIGLKFFRYPPQSGIKLKLLKLFQRTISRIRY